MQQLSIHTVGAQLMTESYHYKKIRPVGYEYQPGLNTRNRFLF